MKLSLTEKTAPFLLAAVIIARATGYLFCKICMEELGMFTLLALRSLTAVALMLPFLWRRLQRISRREVLAGVVVGALFYAVMAAELFGLQRTSTSTAAILENTAIVMVPFIAAIALGSKLKRKAIFCCALATLGVALLSYESGALHFGLGEGAMLLAALFYACTIVATKRVTRGGDALLIGVVQIFTMGILSLLSALAFERIALPTRGDVWACLIYLTLVCTLFGFTLQPMAQSKCSAEKAGLFCAFNPVVSVILGVLVLNEPFGLLDLAGLILVLITIVLFAKE
jgi:drug/metabolite transporter (DMT)-like permease